MSVLSITKSSTDTDSARISSLKTTVMEFNEEAYEDSMFGITVSTWMLESVRNRGVAVTRFPFISIIFNEKSTSPCVSFSSTVMAAFATLPA